MSEDSFDKPYKPHEIIETYTPDSNVKVPSNDQQVVDLAKQVYSASDDDSLLPKGYEDLEREFKALYDKQYSEGLWIDVFPPRLDFLYQQYGLKKDEQLGKTGFNSFGLFIPSYLEGLRTMGVQEGYLGSGGWEHRIKDKYKSLLLGCSSITTAKQFFSFSKAINPNMVSIVTDIDPLAVNLAKEALIVGNEKFQVIESDAQKIPLETGSIDFIATNFLVPNLIDRHGSGKDTLKQVLSEAVRVLSKKGRLVMIEQLERTNLEWLNYWAHGEGLVFDNTGGDGRGILHIATSLNEPKEVTRAVDRIPDFIRESAKEVEHVQTSVFKIDPRNYLGGQRVSGVTTLVYRKRPE